MDLSHYHDAILGGIARALFTSAWIDYQEEFDTGAIDSDDPWPELLPSDNDPAAERTACEIMEALPSLNQDRSVVALYHAYADKALDPALFGHLIGRQAMGPDAPLKEMGIDMVVPAHEFGWLDLDDDYFPAMDHELSDDTDALFHDMILSSAVLAMPVSASLAAGA